ncbi:MAG: hypothetical protein WC007_14500 [Pelobacteraceae bacterium]
MKVKISCYEIFLNIFMLSVLGGLAYFIWALGAGQEWYWRLAWIIGLFGAGALLSWLASRGFGTVPVYVVNLPNNDWKNHE